MAAYAEGKPIEIKKPDREDWIPILFPSWDWINHVYRIAPEPIEVEVWVHPDGSIYSKIAPHSPPVMKGKGFTLRRATIHPETK